LSKIDELSDFAMNDACEGMNLTHLI